MSAERESRSGDRGLLRLRYERVVGGVAIERAEESSNPEPSVLDVGHFITVGSITRSDMGVGDLVLLY